MSTYKKSIYTLWNLAKVGLVAIIITFLIGVWSLIDFFFIKDTYKSNKPIVPELVIEHNDTTYVYNLN